MARIVVGMYDRLEDAHRTVDALVNTGFSRDDISLVAGDTRGDYSRYVSENAEETADGAATGAGIGAVVGGLGGLLVGLGALAIPGIGPVLAAGPLAAALGALAGAGVGAAAGGMIGALVDMGIPEDQAELYSEGVRRGSSLVTVRASDERAEEAVRIMNQFNPIDINRRSDEWRTTQAGMSDRSVQPSAYEPTNLETSSGIRSEVGMDRSREGETFEVVEEELRVGKREVDEGGVRVSSQVTERPVEEQVEVRKEHIEVERRPVDRPASPSDLNTFDEGTIEVTATSEEPVVEKRARVVEEVEVHKDVEHQQETIQETLRRKDVDVEPMGQRTFSDFEEYEPTFRSHFQTSYSHMGHDYESLRPAYTYGYDLANDPRYRNRSWSEIEMDARRDWETLHADSPWENFKDAVRNAWETVTGRR